MNERKKRMKENVWVLVALPLLLSCGGDGKREHATVLLDSARVAYGKGMCRTSLLYLDSVPRITDNQYDLLAADIQAMQVYTTVAANEDFCRSRNSAQMRMQMIRSEQSDVATGARRRIDSLSLVFHLHSYTYYNTLHAREQAVGEVQQIRELEYACRDTLSRLQSVLVTASDSLSLRDYISWCRANRHWMLEGELLLHESRYSLVAERDTLSALLTAEQALQAFDQVDAPFLKVRVLCSLAHLNAVSESPYVALDYLTEALDVLETNYRQEYGNDGHQWSASPDNLDESVELHRWEQHPTSIPLPLLATIREELSAVFAALDEKQLSDYNRNVYLDILDISRQDKETESRVAQLSDMNRRNRILLFALLGLLALMLASVYLFHRMWKRSNVAGERRMRLTSDYCKKLLSGEQPERPDGIYPKLVTPYEEWASYRQGVSDKTDEEYSTSEEKVAVLESQIETNTRKNIEKRAQVGVVEVILPNIERLANMLDRLQRMAEDGKNDAKKSEEIERLRAYAEEMADCILHYNEVVGNWIKMEKGMVALELSTFTVQSVFEYVQGCGHRFERSDRKLCVEPTDVQVKADFAMTFFMVNTLADNARKFTTEGGTITLRVSEATEQYVEISVIDDGIGMSADDVEMLMNEKVYDSSAVGKDRVSKDKKGYGFGIMNCKGIIDKYRKTSDFFSCCTFGVESEPGKGSRFYFRLPRVMAWMGALLLLAGSLTAKAQSSAASSDTLVAQMADSCYTCNLEGRYEQTIVYADSAIRLCNTQLQQIEGRTLSSAERLRLQGEEQETYPECEALNRQLDLNYDALLSIRNEVAVAALALQDRALYDYNNDLYQHLYTLLTQDRSMDSVCERLERSNHDTYIWCVLIILTLIAIPVVYYFRMLHAHVLYRFDVAQMMGINRNILQQAAKTDLVKTFLEDVMKQYCKLSGVEGASIFVVHKGVCEPVAVNENMGRTTVENFIKTGDSSLKDGFSRDNLYAFTLSCGEDIHFAVMLFRLEKCEETPARKMLQKLLHESATGILAPVLHYKRNYQGVTLTKLQDVYDRSNRLLFENVRLHAQNLILDNCLSAIKHETMYYPSLLKRMLSRPAASTADGGAAGVCDWKGLKETADYYKGVLNILCSRAYAQTEELQFRSEELDAEWVQEVVEKVCGKMQRRLKRDIEFKRDPQAEDDFITVRGDSLTLEFLLQLCTEVLCEQTEKELYVRFESFDEDKTKVILGIPNGTWDQAELDQLFYPDEKHYSYLLMRQIIRMHDEYYHFPGCRIVAQVRPEGGYEIWFTLLEE